MSRDDMDTYSLLWMTQTDRAICVRETPFGPDIWLPKSQIEYDDSETPERDEEIEVDIPDWLAEEKGLI